MITLRDGETNELLGTITEEELQFLIDELEEESAEDTDYYVDGDTIDMLEEDGASAGLVAFLRKALGSRGGMQIRWFRSK